MFQLNLPRKAVDTVHVLIAFVLVIAALIFSFAPIITIDLGDEDTIDGINKLIDDMELEGDFELPKEIEISAPTLIKSIGVVVNLISALTSEDEDTLEDVQELLESKEGQQTVITCVSIVYTVAGPFMDSGIMGEGVSDDAVGGVISMIFEMMLTMIALFYLLAMVIIVPIMFIIIAIASLFAVLSNVRDLTEAKPKVARKLPGKLTLVLTVMLFQCILPTVHYGSGINAIFILCLVTIGLNFIATRLRSYESEEFRYINVLQLASIVSIVGFMIFFFNVLQVGIFESFLTGKWSMFVSEATAIQALGNGEKIDTMAHIIEGIVILVYLVIILYSVKFIAKATQRLSCAIPYGKGGITLLPSAIVALLAYILPTYIIGQKHSFSEIHESITDTEKFSFLELTSAQESALTMMLVGAIIMIVAEVALIVLKKVFCPDITTEKVYSVVSGSAASKQKAEVAEEANSAE